MKPLSTANYFVTAILLFLVFYLSTSGAMATTETTGGDYFTFLPVVKSGLVPIIPPTTVTIDEDTLQSLVSVSEDQTYTFSGPSSTLDNLDLGDIMVGGVSDATPFGFLRRVTTIEGTGTQIRVRTAPATLEQAIHQGTLSVNQLLTPSMVQVSEEAPGVHLIRNTASPDREFYIGIQDAVLYDADHNPNTTGDQLRANGEISIEPTIYLDYVIKDGKFTTIVFTQQTTETASLELEAAATLPLIDTPPLTVGRYLLTPIVGSIGVVPIVITPIVTVELSAEGAINVGVTTSVTQEAGYTVGLVYRDAQWHDVGITTNEFRYTPPTLFTNLIIRGNLGPRLDILVNGVGGPYADAPTYLELKAETDETPWWTLYGGLEVKVGFKMDIFSIHIESPTFTVIGVRQLLASAPGGFDCSDVSEIPVQECSALVALYNSTAGSNWLNNDEWLQTNTPCTWYGVLCSGGHIDNLDLSGNRLNGSLPPELGDLVHLGALELDSNRLSGSIPPELGNLGPQTLQWLTLSHNQISGPIPSELGNLTGLRTLYLHDNQLSGPLPPELGNLVALQWLEISNNQLSGPLPQTLINIGHLYLFFFPNTELCEPSNPAFQAWLDGIPEVIGTDILCESKTVILAHGWQGLSPTGNDRDNWDVQTTACPVAEKQPSAPSCTSTAITLSTAIGSLPIGVILKRRSPWREVLTRSVGGSGTLQR